MKKVFENRTFFVGINYWASDTAINMWSDWNEKTVEEDFKRLADAKIEYLRVFPLWSVFQPISAIHTNSFVNEYRMGEHPLPDTEAGRAGVSEEACEKFGRMCALAKKYGLKLIVGLITGHMSYRYYTPPALQGKNLVSDPTAVKWEIRLVKYLVKRFKNEEAIAGWDLGNECCNFASTSDMSYVWTAAIANTIKSVDAHRPVITGFDHMPNAKKPFNLLEIGEHTDINTVHPYHIFSTPDVPLTSMYSILDAAFRCSLYSGISGLPTFIQEVGSTGYANCSEKTESEFYRALLYSAWARNCYGVMWWCAFDQGHMEYAPYDWNNIGSNYGFFRKDGAPKPIVEENKKFVQFLSELPFDSLPPAQKDGIIIVTEDGEEANDILRTAYCLSAQANLNVGFIHASQKIPDSKLYIMPSIDNHHAISKRRLEELLEKVKNGSTLYLSLGKALFRTIPEMTGLTIAYRDGCTAEEHITLGAERLTVKPDYKYVAESCAAEVMARGGDGRPVLVKNNYGKGKIYFSTVPIEKYLAQHKNMLLKDGGNYYEWYRCISCESKTGRAMDIRSKAICLTEHQTRENERYAVILNCSPAPAIAEFSIGDQWRIDKVYTGSVCARTIRLPQCAAAVIRLVTKGGASAES